MTESDGIRKIRAHLIASVAYRLGLKRTLSIQTRDLEPESGAVVMTRILSDKRVYNQVELVSGRMAPVRPGEILVGALGCRRALRGFVGEVPTELAAGDHLQLLNLGGVIGHSSAPYRDLGPPATVEVLGHVLGNGKPLNIRDGALPIATEIPESLPPIVLVSGTCMNSGKTFACAQMVQEAAGRGLRVHGGKLTGVACRRDLISLEDQGATRTASFLDVGHASTAGLEASELRDMTRTVLAYLAEGDPDVIFLELGDGIIGDYGVLAILEDPLVREHVSYHLLCAQDMVGSWGGVRYLADHGIGVNAISGPTTDTPVGVEFVEKSLGLPATNARLEPARLTDLVLEGIGLGSGREASTD